jgi:hypothetical protein
MTGNAINANGEALELHELSSGELDAVSGGSDKENQQKTQENIKQAQTLKTFSQALQDLA